MAEMAKTSADYLVAMLADADLAAVAWIVDAARRAVSQQISLQAAAGLAPTPARRRRGLRDHYLLVAALNLTGGPAPATPLKLHREVERYRREYSGPWGSLREPPAAAASYEKALFWSFRHGGLPDSPQGLGKIIRGAWEMETEMQNRVSETNLAVRGF